VFDHSGAVSSKFQLGPTMLTFERVSWTRSERVARLALTRGSVAAGLIVREIDSFATCWLIDPTVHRDADSFLDDSFVGRSSQPDTDACLGTFVGTLPGVRTVLVEDEIAVRGDSLSGDFACIDHRVVRWADVSDGLLEASRLLRPGGGGVPLCGYLSTSSPTELALSPGSALSAPHVAMLVASIVAVMVPVCETQAQVALCRDGPRPGAGG
jgi:hypothetical protein